MSDHFINLNCTSCGGKLDVYDDMERFVCSYCGSAMVVQRRGGTVALKAVTEAIKQVQLGTDKTAAELAIVRCEKELQELRIRLELAEKSDNSGGCATMGFGAIVLVGGVLACLNGGSSDNVALLVGGALICLVGGAVLFFGYKASTGKSKAAPIRERIAIIKKQMAEKRLLVDS